MEWNSLSRSQKATRFRLKRRLQNLNLYGQPLFKRANLKNGNRQVAACNRKRDYTGKFLLGPRKQRNRFYLPGFKGAIFKITKVSCVKAATEVIDTCSQGTCESLIGFSQVDLSFLKPSRKNGEFLNASPWLCKGGQVPWSDESNCLSHSK